MLCFQRTVFVLAFAFGAYGAGGSTAALAQAGTSCYAPDCRAYPDDFGHLNVRDFGAVGDGVHDDTQAFIDALRASGDDMGRNVWQNRIVYVPNGEYLVSDTITRKYEDGRFANGFWIVGQSRAGTVIKLKDNANGFSDVSAPKAVFYTSSKLIDGTPTSGNKDYTNKGEGNDAYMNFVENLTLDVGHGNAGAIGIDFLANNMGAIRRVTLIAPAGSGETAISMARRWPGPALISDVETQGFDTGLKIRHSEYSMTLENVHIQSPRSVAIDNTSNLVTGYDLSITDAPIALMNSNEKGMIVLTKAQISAQSGSLFGDVIQNNAFMTLSDVHVTQAGGDAVSLDGVYTGANKTDDVQWALPIKQPPKLPQVALSQWHKVEKDAAQSASDDPNDSAAIEAAFASGAKVIYFPYGVYHINRNIKIPPSVEYIIGMNAKIRPTKNRAGSFNRDYGMFRVEAGQSPLTIEGMVMDHTDLGRQVGIDVMGDRVVSLRDVAGLGVGVIKRQFNGGELFVENTCCGTMEFDGSAGVWGRQINSEGGGTRIVNKGAPFWVLGLKAERYNTLVNNDQGGKSEIMGALVYPVQSVTNLTVKPLFVNANGTLNAAFVEEAFYADRTYQVYLQDHVSTPSKQIMASSFPPRREGRSVAFLHDKTDD